MGQSRVGGIERVRGRGSYGTALTFDLISLPASLETSCRPLPRAYLEPRLYFVTDSSARLSRRRVVVVREKYKGGKRETNFWTLRILFVYYYWCESACVTYIDMFSMFRQCISYRRDTQMWYWKIMQLLLYFCNEAIKGKKGYWVNDGCVFFNFLKNIYF